MIQLGRPREETRMLFANQETMAISADSGRISTATEKITPCKHHTNFACRRKLEMKPMQCISRIGISLINLTNVKIYFQLDEERLFKRIEVEPQKSENAPVLNDFTLPQKT